MIRLLALRRSAACLAARNGAARCGSVSRSRSVATNALRRIPIRGTTLLPPPMHPIIQRVHLATDRSAAVLGRAPLFRLLGLSAVALVGGILIALFSWPFMHTLILPWSMRRAMALSHKKRRPCHTGARDDEVHALNKYLSANNAQLIVLVGSPGCGKSAIVQELALGSSDRPSLYSSTRISTTEENILYAFLVQSFEPLGVMGNLVLAYTQIANAAMDMLVLNQHHEHTTITFFNSYLGFLRNSLRNLEKQRRTHQEIDNPLLVWYEECTLEACSANAFKDCRRFLEACKNMHSLLDRDDMQSLLETAVRDVEIRRFLALMGQYSLYLTRDDKLSNVVFAMDNSVLRTALARKCGANSNTFLEEQLPDVWSRAKFIYLSPYVTPSGLAQARDVFLSSAEREGACDDAFMKRVDDVLQQSCGCAAVACMVVNELTHGNGKHYVRRREQLRAVDVLVAAECTVAELARGGRNIMEMCSKQDKKLLMWMHDANSRESFSAVDVRAKFGATLEETREVLENLASIGALERVVGEDAAKVCPRAPANGTVGPAHVRYILSPPCRVAMAAK